MLQRMAAEMTPYPAEAQERRTTALSSRLDGRKRRGERTRMSILQAALDLLQSGQLQPSAQAIAERAQVSLRAIFHHFGDLERLLRCAVDVHLSRHPMEALPPLVTTGTLEERVVAFAARRAATFERILPVHRSVLLKEPADPDVAVFLDKARSLARRELNNAFAEELRGASENGVEALMAATCWLGWEALRVRAKVSYPRARDVLEHTVRTLLAAR